MILVALFIFTWMRKLETDEKYRVDLFILI